jgi:hypothetical protein
VRVIIDNSPSPSSPPARRGEIFKILRVKLLLLQEFLCRHEKGFPITLDPFIIFTHEDRIHRTYFLAITTKDASAGIELIGKRISFPLLIFSRLNIDALGRADSHTEATGDTLGFPTLILLKILNPPPTFRRRHFFLRILNGDGSGEEIS